MSTPDLESTLDAATWVPRVIRDNTAGLLPTATDAAKELLAFALASGQTAAVAFWRTLVRQYLPRDPHRRLTPELQRHLISVSGARTVQPATLDKAIKAIFSAAGPVAVDAAQQALLQLGRGLSLAQAHGLYVSAARKAPAAALPRSAPHLGGPIPELSVFETVELAIALATIAAAKQPSDEVRLLIERATRVLKLVRTATAQKASRADREVPDTAPKKGPAFTLARAAVKEAWSTDHVSARGTSINSAVVAGLQLGDPAWWLGQIDEQVMCCDARTAWERRDKSTSSPLVHCVWRGGDSTSRIWLGRLESGRYALLSKLGRTWNSTEGDLDSVVATIPDGWFATAMPIIEARR
jgi:hypothetical protein